MISINELKTQWKAIVPQSGQSIGRRADDTHPLAFFITYSEECKMQLMLVSEFVPNLPESSQQISVCCRKRSDGKYAVCLALENEGLCEQYIALCWDLMNCTYNIGDTSSGVKTAVKRFRMWQKLFAKYKDKKMSDTEIKGLIGELAFLKTVALERYPLHMAVAGWIGPIGADRDFEYNNCWYEIKTTTLSRETIKISSFDQLDTNQEGRLAIMRIEKSANTLPNSFTLNSLVSDIYGLIADNREAVSLFESRLIASQYDNTDIRAEESFVLHKAEYYMIDKSFPALRRSMIPAAISNGSYELSIAGIQAWRCDEKQEVSEVKVG